MKKKIGIIGLGVVGKSVLRFFQGSSEAVCSVWDQQFCDIPLESFFEKNDIIIPSPGVDLRPYERQAHKIVCELDLFAIAFRKKTIAITGTLGKTSITRALGELIPGAAVAGNIGYPMLDLIANQHTIDIAILELSSFQLDQSKLFAPDLAIWTNFYPNHLDRHTTIKSYFDAKWRLFAHQTSLQHALLPAQIFTKEYAAWTNDHLRSYRGQYEILPDAAGFEQNQQIVTKVLNKPAPRGPRGAHRLEHFLTYNGVDFYNDSKATVMQATQVAVQTLAANERPIVLVVGGLGKGVDRTPLVRFVANEQRIKTVLCLGSHSDEFACYEQYASLPDLVHAIMQTVVPGDQVLFSPSGASFDLFAGFEERGDLFKRAVKEELCNGKRRCITGS